MGRRSHRRVDRPSLLRAIGQINEHGMATAKRLGEEFEIPSADARELCQDEVREGFLLSQTAKLKYSFVWYSLTEKGAIEARRAA